MHGWALGDGECTDGRNHGVLVARSRLQLAASGRASPRRLSVS